MSPTQIGPFVDADHAIKYVDQHDGLGDEAQDGYGGYSQAVIVCAENAQSPMEHDREWKESESELELEPGERSVWSAENADRLAV
jgi:hypothetical protein